MSPILYTIVVADIPQLQSNNLHLSRFADDVAIWSSLSNPVLAETFLQRYIDNKDSWCNDWRLTLNPQKSLAMYVRRKDVL